MAMSFRGRSRFRRRRFFPRRRFRPFAHRVRPKYDNITLFNNLDSNLGPGCGPLGVVNCNSSQEDSQCHPPGGEGMAPFDCCNSPITIELFTNEVLESFYQDKVTIVRMVGDLWVRSFLNAPFGAALCDPEAGDVDFNQWVDQYVARYGEIYSLGLRKYEQTMAPNSADPDDDRANPLYGYDWTEAHWLKQWFRFWAPTEWRKRETVRPQSVIGVCSNTTRNSYVVPAETSGSQPMYSVPAESTNCVVIRTTQGEGDDCHAEINSLYARMPPWHHFRISSKRHITMARDQSLNLQLSRRSPAMPGNTFGWGCNPALVNEVSNTNFFCRVRAIIRLN